MKKWKKRWNVWKKEKKNIYKNGKKKKILTFPWKISSMVISVYSSETPAQMTLLPWLLLQRFIHSLGVMSVGASRYFRVRNNSNWNCVGWTSLFNRTGDISDGSPKVWRHCQTLRPLRWHVKKVLLLLTTRLSAPLRFRKLKLKFEKQIEKLWKLWSIWKFLPCPDCQRLGQFRPNL